MQTHSAFIKLKFSLSNVRPQSRRRKGGDVELNSFSNCHKYRSRIWVSTAEQTEKKAKFHPWRGIPFLRNENFPDKKLVLRVKEEK